MGHPLAHLLMKLMAEDAAVADWGAFAIHTDQLRQWIELRGADDTISRRLNQILEDLVPAGSIEADAVRRCLVEVDRKELL